MSANAEKCGNCGFENPPGKDFCENCGQPLTRSAAEGMRVQAEAQEAGGGIGSDASGLDRPGSSVRSGVVSTSEEMPPRS